MASLARSRYGNATLQLQPGAPVSLSRARALCVCLRVGEWRGGEIDINR
eukprot:COSAG02_NODE_3373_length_6852_cov_3.840071_9_plen_49_part_00